MAFRQLLDRIMKYTIDGGNQADIHRFLDCLSEQILSWTEQPPQTPEELQKAREIVDVVKNFYFKTSSLKYLNPVKGKIYLLHGIIHAHGLSGTSKNENQAILSFIDAAKFGNKQGYAYLGEIYFAKALKTEPQDLIKNAWVKKAIEEYEKGRPHTTDALVRTLYQIYEQQLKAGKLTIAKLYLEKMLKITKVEADEPFTIQPGLIKRNLENLEKLMAGIADAQQASVRFIECFKLESSILESEFLKGALPSGKKSNPVVDYYHLLILRKMRARLTSNKNPTDEDKLKIQNLQQKCDSLKQKLLNKNNYDPVFIPLLDFVYGLGIFEDQLFKSSELDGKTAQFYFEKSAKEGCYMAFSYLANIAQLSQGEASQEALAYYLRGASAGDPRSLISYFHRFLSIQIKSALESDDADHIVSFCEETIDVLQLAKDNPSLVQENLPYILEQIKLIDDYRKKYSDYPEEFTISKWDDIKDGRLSKLKSEIVNYNKLDNNDYKKKIYSLRKINHLLEEALAQTGYDDNINSLLKAMKLKMARAIEYVNSQKIKADFHSYLTTDSQQLAEKEKSYYDKLGHMGSSYYAELMDPYHRLPAWLRVKWQESEWKDESFSVFLGHSTALDSDVPRAIYLDKYQREQLEISVSEKNQLKYKQTDKLIPDGKYLYVIDRKKNRLFLQKEYTDAQHSFYHSSFLRGKHVVSAGEIVIQNGRLIHINNGSGHYAPTVTQLSEGIETLKKLNLLDTENKDLTIGIFGVKSVKKPLSYSQFQELHESILAEEAKNRDMSAFAALAPQSIMDEPHDDSITLAPSFDPSIVRMIDDFIAASNSANFEKYRARIHPLFPTLLETKSPTLSTLKVRSDHLPIFSAIPVSPKRSDDIKILSWNVLGAGAENNLTRIIEGDYSAKGRYEACARGILASVRSLDLDIIALQEVSSKIMAPILLGLLGDEWGMAPSMDVVLKEGASQLTFYRKSKLKLINVPTLEFGKLSTTFLHLNAQKTLHMHNVWTKYNIVPYDTEQFYLGLLADKKTDEIAIVMGDTNSRLAPVFDDTPMNLTTGIIPAVFNKNDEYKTDDKSPSEFSQVPDQPDGGFYTDDKNKIRQLKIQTIDPTTGLICMDRRKFGQITSHIHDQSELAIWSLPRAILCIDSHYFKEKFIADKTIYAYEQELQKMFADQHIRVRMSATVFNAKGICICFKPLSIIGKEASVADLLSYILPPEVCKLLRVDGAIESAAMRLPIVFIPISEVKTLVDAIIFIHRHNLVSILHDKIGQLGMDSLNTTAAEVIKKGIENYKIYNESRELSLGKVMRAMDRFGIHQSLRSAEALKRVNLLREENPESADSEILLKLLDTRGTCDLSSFNYSLASAFTGISVKSNEEASLLVTLVKHELERRIAHPLKAPKLVEQKEKKGSETKKM